MMTETSFPISGAGLGLRRPFIDELMQLEESPIEFLEIAPENWMEVGGKRQKYLAHFTQSYPVLCHGLSLSIGGPNALNEEFIKQIKCFLDEYQIDYYSEHLSYAGDDAYLYDLLPIPFTEEAVHYLAERIRRTQDILQRCIAIENISYYATPSHDMDELTFINAVISEADCDLLLDVNNVYVNSINHGYDPQIFIQLLDPTAIPYIHIAGHTQESEDLLIDTHGSPVIDPVWELLEFTYQQFGTIPTLLERDNAIPSLTELITEVQQIKKIQEQFEIQTDQESSDAYNQI